MKAMGQKNKALALLSELGLDGLLISDGYNIHYLSGFTGATGYLYISKGCQMILTDSRYTLQAQNQSDGFEVFEISSNCGYEAKLESLMTEEGVQTLGIEDKVTTLDTYMRLKEKFAGIELVPLESKVDLLRMIKTPEELEYIGQAAAIADGAFEHILTVLKPGITELYVAAELEYYMKTHGAQGLSFETIAVSGLNGAKPHGVPGNKLLQAGEFLTMDFGCCYEGYCSDMTRTVVIGKADQKQKEVYGTVLKAQTEALEAIKAGIQCDQVDAIARTIIGEAGYGAYFGHGLGHSAGLFIHEEPRLSPSCKMTLKANMTMTVEPGIYIPDFGGVRIEDLVYITQEGCVNLTHSEKNLLEL